MRFDNVLTPQEICRKLKPVIGKQADALWLNYTFADSREKKEEVEQMLKALYMKYLNQDMLNQKVLLEPPNKELINGDYPLGIVRYAEKNLYPFGLRNQDMVRHVCICGMSGSGKTNLAFQMIKSLIVKDKPFLIFDWKKSFRPLMTVDEHMHLYTVGNERISNFFRVNINKPPKNVSPKEWINILADIITESFFASHGVHKLLTETMDEAFHDFKVYEGSENYPTWLQIKDRLEEKEAKVRMRGREAEWITSALRIAHALTFGGLGKAINYKGRESNSVEELFDKRCIFELYSLNNAEKKFFCSYLLTYIYKLNKTNYTVANEDFKYAIIVDEAHNIFLRDKPTFMKETITDMVYREIREYGVGLICLDQHISKLSETVSGNSACVIAFQQMLPEDVNNISRIMQMWESQKHFSMLDVGEAIVRLAERHHSPFLIKVPLISLRKQEFSDDKVFLRMSAFTRKMALARIIEESREDTLKEEQEAAKKFLYNTGVVAQADIELYPDKAEASISRDRFLEKSYDDSLISRKDKSFLNSMNNLENNPWSMEALNPRLQKECSCEEPCQTCECSPATDLDKVSQIFDKPAVMPEQKAEIKKEPEHISKSYSLTTTQKNFLALLANQQTPLGTTQLYQMLNLSGRKGNELKNELLKLGMIHVKEVRTNSGWKKEIHPTELGKKLAC